MQVDGWRCTGCGTDCGVRTASSGSFSDGSGSSNYPDNAVCEWVLIPTGAAQVTVTFTSFSTELDYDFVKVHWCTDNTCTLGGVLGQLTGTYSSQQSFTSTTGFMYIRFTSDNSLALTGFTATYTSTTQAAAPTVCMPIS